jgi:acyl-homoserine lactone synthase
MIHLVTAENKHLYKRELREQHRVRHDIYVDERGWEALRSKDCLERDQFDNDDAVYLLAIENDRVVGGSRFSPTTQPHLLSEVFPHLAEVRGLPRAPDIVEWTRLFAVKEHRASWRSNGTIGQLLCGGLEWCVGDNISAFTLLFEMWHLPKIHDTGWLVTPLGLPALIENDWWLAAKVQVDDQTLRSTRHYCDVPGPVLVRNGISEPERPRRYA